MTCLLYVAAEYPKLSETFVYREVIGLRKAGLRVPVVSVRPSADDPACLPPESLEDRIELYGAGWPALGRDGLSECLRAPLSSMKTLASALRDAVFPGEPTSVPTRAKALVHGFAALALARRVRPLGADHLHAHMAHVPTSIARYTARQLGVGFSFTGHAADLFRDRALLLRKLRDASHVHCISLWHREFYCALEERPDTDYPIVRCGVNPDDYEFQPKETLGNPPLILGVGRLVRKKGFDYLIDAMAALRSGGFPMRLSLIGDGPEAEALQQQAAALGIAEHVEFGGSTDNRGVADAMGRADLFVLPCRIAADGDKDGIPVVLMEAMARGLPVISGDLPAIRELVVDGRTGLLVSPGDDGALVSAIRRVFDPEFPRASLARRAREHVAEEFFLDPNRRRILNVLHSHGISIAQPGTE